MCSSGLGDGSLWANASSNLQGQIDATGVEQVWVAAGTYKPISGVVVEVDELNGIATSGTITIKITRDPVLSLSLPTSATSVNDHTVQNSVWQLNLNDPDYYVLTTNQSIAGDGVLAVGLTDTLNPGGTTGILTISSVLVNIPGETRRSNNTDADRIEYFP